MRRLAFVAPVVALLALLLSWERDLSVWAFILDLLVLGSVVVAAVYHAEVIAHRVGEPFGTLVLAVAVTVIEVALIVSIMLASRGEPSALAGDTVFSVVLITCNGIVGLSLLIAAFRHRVPSFSAEGSGAALATVAALATLTLVVPRFTTSTPGPTMTGAQLTFAALASLVLYGLFVFVQAIRHREFFIPDTPEGTDSGGAPDGSSGIDDERPSKRDAVTSLIVLIISLIGVVGLAKTVSPNIEETTNSVGLPPAFVGVVIAALILLPEGGTAVRAAWNNRLQSSMNLALGSAMASIGLTIPVIAVVSELIDTPLLLGMTPVQVVLFGLTMFVAALTITPGRSTVMQGGVHLVLFVGFVVLSASP
jgi:Ca2+:H+ antiporter